MKKIIIIILVMSFTGFMHIAWSNSIPVKETGNLETESLFSGAEHQAPLELKLEEVKVDCSIKVKSEEFTGTITFHDVSIFQCAIIKLANFFR